MFPAKESQMKFALIALIAILAGCESYRDIAAPVEEPSRDALNRGWCPIYVESSLGRVEVDSGTICEDGTQPVLLRIARPYVGIECQKMTYIQNGSRWIYGCSAKPEGPAPKPL